MIRQSCALVGTRAGLVRDEDLRLVAARCGTGAKTSGDVDGAIEGREDVANASPMDRLELDRVRDTSDSISHGYPWRNVPHWSAHRAERGGRGAANPTGVTVERS